MTQAAAGRRVNRKQAGYVMSAVSWAPPVGHKQPRSWPSGQRGAAAWPKIMYSITISGVNGSGWH